MPGHIILEGGAEFGGRMAEPDLRAIELAGGLGVPMRIIPAAAAPDANHKRAGGNGVRWFRHLGATDVEWLPLIDRASAGRPEIAEALSAARLIFLLGGFPHHLGQTLRDSAAWQAILRAHTSGAVVAGSSAGAMVLCEHYYDPQSTRAVAGLNMVPRTCVLPHHNTFGAGWAPRLAQQLADSVLIGIDERTGMIDEGAGGAWHVYGHGAVTIYRRGQPTAYRAGEVFRVE
jgi:cyanophycinase